MKNKTTIGKSYLDKFLSHSDDELYHYGTKGQKWGIRNYQNKDGTLTEAGKARYNDSGTYKDPEKMSTDDLIKSSNRLNAEYNYKRLQDISTPEKRSQQKRAAIKKAALSSLISTGATFAATYGVSALYNKVKGKKVRAGEMAANAAIASLVVGAGTLPNLFNAVNIPNVQVQSQIDKSKNDNKDKDSAKHSDEFSDELYHYGIKGQKWGIRRYQNEDGTLTEEGLKRKEQYKKALNEELRETTNNIALRNYSRYDPKATAYGVDKEADKKAAESMKRGKELVKKMINDGFISDKITYDDFRKVYEKQLISGYNSFCKVVGLDPNDEKNVEWYYYSSTLKDSAKHSDEFSDELYHYGIKGQKWGIRRYQNPDGSLTDEGLIRYGVDSQGNMSTQGKSLYKKDKQHDKARKIATGAAIGIGAAAAVVAGTHAVNLILDKKYGKGRAANIIGPKGDHSSFRIGKNLPGTKVSSRALMTGHKWFTDYSFKFKNTLNKKTGKIVNTNEFKRGINWAKAIGLASSLGFIGGAVAKRLTKNKQKENDYVVKQQMNEVSNQKALDYYKRTGKLPVSTEKKRR